MNGLLRWVPIILAVIVSIHYAITQMEWADYAFGWIGTMFKALSGGAIGWAVSRFVCRLDLSSIDPAARPTAALSQAILISGFAVAVAGGL